MQKRRRRPSPGQVDLTSKGVEASDAGEVSATITAYKDAPLGEHTVTVTGTPGKGSPATVDLKIQLKEGNKT